MKTRENELLFISVFLDLLVLNFSVLLFALLLFRFEFHSEMDLYLCLLITNFSWVLAYLFIRKRVLYLKKGFKSRFFRMIKRGTIFLALTALFYFLFVSIIGHLWFFLLLSGLFFVLSKLISNYLYYRVVRYYHLKSSHVRRALLIGDNETMRKVKRIIKVNPILKYMFVGFLSEHANGKNVLGTPADLKEVVRDNNIQVVFVTVKNPGEIINNSFYNTDLLHTCNQLGVRLYYVPENEDIETGHFHTEKMNAITLINPQRIPMDQIENQIKKRLFDLVFSGLVILLLLSWLYPILGLLIKLSSKGPVLFTQKRTGINKVTFNCYKFRSMRQSIDADLKQATEDDPRITWIGKFIRRTNIDELPQFINVFRGDMSVEIGRASCGDRV